MPVHFLPLAIGYVAATLLRDDDDDCIPFVNPFLVHINANVYEDNVLKFERGEYVAVRAYIIGLESHWLYGTQDGGSFASKFKAEHVTDVGDIGKCGWEYMEASSSHNRYYVRSTGLQQQELVLEEPHRGVDGLDISRPKGLNPRFHHVHSDKGSVLIETASHPW